MIEGHAKEAHMRPYQIFSKLQGFPFGKKIFSLIVCMKAPYFHSIHPLILTLSKDQCLIKLKKRRSVTNHLGTIHAIAMCNGCELAFGMVMESGLAPNLRWIPKGMTVRYLKKAETDLLIKCEYPQIHSLTPGDHPILVQALDAQNQIVMDAQITVYVSERKK